MKRLINTEQGFSFAGVILVLVILVVIGVVGYVVVKHNDSKKPVEGVAVTTKTSTTPAPTTVVKIAELGIALTVPNSLKDLTYSMSQNGSIPVASFSTKSITSGDNECSANGSAPPLGYLEKVSGQYNAASKATNDPTTFEKQFNNFYIVWGPSEASCSNSSTQSSPIFNQLLMQDEADFESSLNSANIQLIQ